VDLEEAELRYAYAVLNPESAAVSHYNLATYLKQAGRDPALAITHRLAAALIWYHVGERRRLATALRAVAGELAGLDDSKLLPASADELRIRVEQVDGVRLDALLDRLAAPASDSDQALADVIRLVQAHPIEPDIGGYLRQWTPVIDDVIAATRGDRAAADRLAQELDRLAASADWANLVGVLRRVLDGERDQTALTTGLDLIDTAIATEALRRLQDE
jgi:hypothetical protein